MIITKQVFHLLNCDRKESIHFLLGGIRSVAYLGFQKRGWGFSLATSIYTKEGEGQTKFPIFFTM